MRELKSLFENNEKWAKGHLEKNPHYFEEKAEKQAPLYLWIGCSDSRVPANEVVGLEAGELFVHRNIANLCSHTDFSSLSVIEFAVEVLEVKHIIVCGHYGCGGVKAAMEDHQLGLVDNWLRHIRDVYAKHHKELDKLEDKHKKLKKLVELNVVEQVLHVCHTTIVQRAWNQNKELHVHGWVYDLETGRLKDLSCCVSSPMQLEKLYRINTVS